MQPRGGRTSTTAELSLEPNAMAPRLARNFAARTLETWHRGDLSESAVLGVSELVTNACIHARSMLVLRVCQIEGRLRLEVSDSSPVIPATKRHSPTATTGRGMQLLDALGNWGVESTDAGKTVWFEPDPESEVGSEAL